jgi:hypothetical protein
MFSATEATARYQPRPGDAPVELLGTRLLVCQACEFRQAHTCKVARQLVTIVARTADAFCPAGLWGARKPPPPAPPPQPVVATDRADAWAPCFATEALDPDPERFPPLDAPQLIRNLICHMYPRTAGQKWRRTVEHLAARALLFNGRRIVAIARDQECDPAADVRDAFWRAGFDAEFLEVPNDNVVGEVATFPEMLARVASTDPGAITFYCHSKGSTWPQASHSSHEWADVMFAANLDYPELVARALSTAAFAGAFRSDRALHSAPWHYSGTFFWFRNDVVFAGGRWRAVDQKYGGIEAWPGLQCPAVDQSACLFLDHCPDLYQPEIWETIVRPAWRAFRKSLRNAPGDGSRPRRAASGLSEVRCSPSGLLQAAFERAWLTPWSINEHLPVLRMLAGQCESVTEFGVERGTSTTAFLAAQPGRLTSYDHAPARPEIEQLKRLAGRTIFEFHQADSRFVEIVPTDLLFIDTRHTADQLAAELQKHHDKARRWIVLHDTVTFGETGEDGGPGLLPALREFLAAHPEWSIAIAYTNNHGLTLLKRS